MRRFKYTEKSREGIPGFGTRLNKILEIGMEHGIWEMGCNEGDWTGWEEDHAVGWIRHNAGVDCLEGLRGKRSLQSGSDWKHFLLVARFRKILIYRAALTGRSSNGEGLPCSMPVPTD